MLVSESSAMHQLRPRSAQKPQLDLIAVAAGLEASAKQLISLWTWGTSPRPYSVQVGHLHVGRPHDDYVCRSRRQATRQPEGDPMPKMLSFTGRWWVMPARTVARA